MTGDQLRWIIWRYSKHIKEQLHSNKAEVFIQHYCNKYDTPENPTSPFSSRLKELLTEYKEVATLDAMGFQTDWMNEKMWIEKIIDKSIVG